MNREDAEKKIIELAQWRCTTKLCEGRISCHQCKEDRLEEVMEVIEALSQPERPKGRWEFVELKDRPLYGKPHKVGEWRCPFCGRTVAFKPPFCHCGADMRGEE